MDALEQTSVVSIKSTKRGENIFPTMCHMIIFIKGGGDEPCFNVTLNFETPAV